MTHTAEETRIETEATASAKKIQSYKVFTDQAMDAFLQSAADGRSGNHWKNNEQAESRTWDAGLGHYVMVKAEPHESDFQALENLTATQDANSGIVILYIANLLQPLAPLPDDLERSVWIDLLDVARKAGLLNREGLADRDKAVRFVWYTLQFGARANVRGRRSTTYRDPITKIAISTEVDGPIWMLGHRERPTQGTLFPSMEIPVRQRVTITKEWERLMFESNLAQYLPCGELIGAIPPKQPSGAWARAIGLALTNFWRRNPNDALSGNKKPTRRELLTRYIPAVANPEDILNGENPSKAIKYWLQALGILVDQGLLEKKGEANLTPAQIKANLPRYEWQNLFLNGAVELHPGPAIRPAIEGIAQRLPKSKPRQLTGTKRTRKKVKN